MGNLVEKLPNYRYYTIHRLPQLLVLDFKKIKLKVTLTQERQAAQVMFGHDGDILRKKRKLSEEA